MPYVFQRLLANAFHVVQFVKALKCAVLTAVIDNPMRQRFADAVQRLQLFNTCFIDIHNRFAFRSFVLIL